MALVTRVEARVVVLDVAMPIVQGQQVQLQSCTILTSCLGASEGFRVVGAGSDGPLCPENQVRCRS